jgi:predicted GH43/DUF377 family glycosyl hydrolase
MIVECLLNPGVFRFDGYIWLLVRVAERPKQVDDRISLPILRHGNIEILSFEFSDPLLDTSDPREPSYDGEVYLSTLSHLRLFKSHDGITFKDAGRNLVGVGPLESYGIEDCRVATMPDGEFLLTYTATSASGYGVGLRRTRDWQTFEHLGMILPPANKDCAIFAEKVDGQYLCFHRPSGVGLGGNYIWLAFSPDLQHWGGHVCIAHTREGMWDSARIGAGAAPIRTERGWLAIYHGANADNRYCLGALLLDLDDPTRVLARSADPIMEPQEDYELNGFFGNVVFTNGHLREGDRLVVYYGASDTVICSATFSINAILNSL